MKVWTVAVLALAGSALGAPAPPPGLRLALPTACSPETGCPVQNYVDRDPGPGVADYSCSGETYDKHDGTDFRIPDLAAMRAGVAVLAAAPGKVLATRDAMDDVSIRTGGEDAVAGKECGNGVLIDHGGGWQTQYCHMRRGSVAVAPGETVRPGQAIGKVGLSGDTEFPHLHLTVRHAGVAVDPFDPDPRDHGCAIKNTLWSEAAARALPYRRGDVLNAGFATLPVESAEIEDGAIEAPGARSSALVAYVRVIGLEAGDRQRLMLKAPNGTTLAVNDAPPPDHPKAQWTMIAGKRLVTAAWPSGDYVADYQLVRNGATVLTKRFSVRL